MKGQLIDALLLAAAFFVGWFGHMLIFPHQAQPKVGDLYLWAWGGEVEHTDNPEAARAAERGEKKVIKVRVVLDGWK